MIPMRSLIACVSMCSTFAANAQQDHSHHHSGPVREENARSTHIPPDPPSSELGPMSPEQMHEMMDMDDSLHFARASIDRLEWQTDDVLAWDANASVGGDINKLLLKSEGDTGGDGTRVRNEVLWDRIVSPWWELQAGVRVDSGSGPTRTWAALGFEGTAPYWINVDATIYAGDEGRTAARLEAKYDLRVTQRWILQPMLEVNAYGKSDPERGIGSGLSALEASLRLRYEIRRELAPYAGIHWTNYYGRTADYVSDAHELSAVAGIKLRF